jgi:translation initiation factor IF-2
MVTEGKIVRGAKVRVRRGNTVAHEGTITSLRRFKDDVREVTSGFECGIALDGMNDVKVGDVIEAFTTEEIQRTL